MTKKRFQHFCILDLWALNLQNVTGDRSIVEHCGLYLMQNQIICGGVTAKKTISAFFTILSSLPCTSEGQNVMGQSRVGCWNKLVFAWRKSDHFGRQTQGLHCMLQNTTRLPAVTTSQVTNCFKYNQTENHTDSLPINSQKVSHSKLFSKLL